jgi:hypothetical protein
VGAEVMCVGLVEDTGIEGVRFQYNWLVVYVKKERRFKLIFRQAKRETAEKGLESEKFGFADRGILCLRQHYIGPIEPSKADRTRQTWDGLLLLTRGTDQRFSIVIYTFARVDYLYVST